MWHYQTDNQPTGPIDFSEVEALIQKGKITRSTKVWREGMADWQPAIETELQSAFPQNVPPPIAPKEILNQRFATGEISKEEYDRLIQKIDTSSTVETRMEKAVSPIYAISLSFLPLISLVNPWFIEEWPLMPLAMMPLALAGSIFWLIFIYKIWNRISSRFPDNSEIISPGKAVGFLFIPLFNLYWIYPVLVRPLKIVRSLDKSVAATAIPVMFIVLGYLFAVTNFATGVMYGIDNAQDGESGLYPFIELSLLLGISLCLLQVSLGSIYTTSIASALNRISEQGSGGNG